MRFQLLIGIAAGLLQVGATLPYVVSILRGRTAPNAVSWVLWTLTVAITLAAQVASGASWSLFLLGGALLCNLAIVVLCLLGYGYRAFGRVDRLTVILVVAAIAGWIVSSDPIVAMIFAIAADTIAYAPTLLKVRRLPGSEPAIYWGLLLAADILALVSVDVWTIANVSFPIAYGVMNGIGLVMILGMRGRAGAASTTHAR